MNVGRKDLLMPHLDSFVEVTTSNFKDHFLDLKELLKENMIRHYEAKKIDDGYFDIKIMEIRDYLADERAVVFLYKNNEKGGETCGCIWGYPKVFLDEKRLFVQLLQVHPEYRGRGIGKTLLSRLEKYAVENGYDAIDMITSASNDGAIRFYEREGYEIERLQLYKILR